MHIYIQYHCNSSELESQLIMSGLHEIAELESQLIMSGLHEIADGVIDCTQNNLALTSQSSAFIDASQLQYNTVYSRLI